ncbi:aldehyde dehydrogenase family protein [uncultured Propionivibrio sp.]|uniref:aldehyde dehydrogenase family protein n=1 Tax=uncultured Propionivibrio sp. TaxID=426737 RepID=UPI0029C03B06|nr:aldehyde dehydrogenase family protein [uncultured Propionivibrio sp.]
MTELRISEGDVAALPVLPLWIDGHAYLSVCRQYGVLPRAASGVPVRRFPVCGSTEVVRACASARNALAETVDGTSSPEAVWRAWADLVERYHGHLTGLLQEDSGWPAEVAAAEVTAVATCLRDAFNAGPRCLAIIGPEAAAPVSGALRAALPILRADGCVIVLSSSQAPSVMVALAELSARAGLRSGVFSLLHGDATTWAALCAQPGVTRLTDAAVPD